MSNQDEPVGRQTCDYRNDLVEERKERESVDTGKKTIKKSKEVQNNQLAAIAKQAKKAGGFQQVYGPLGDILGVGSE
jgi:hypothetical protein